MTTEATIEIRRIAYNLGQAAAALGIGRNTLAVMVRTGRIPHIFIGETVLIGTAALERWLTDECLSNLRASAPVPTPVRRRRQRAA